MPKRLKLTRYFVGFGVTYCNIQEEKTAQSCKHNDNIVKLHGLDPLIDIPDSV
jgi:hypothetical protein